MQILIGALFAIIVGLIIFSYSKKNKENEALESQQEKLKVLNKEIDEQIKQINENVDKINKERKTAVDLPPDQVEKYWNENTNK